MRVLDNAWAADNNHHHACQYHGTGSGAVAEADDVKIDLCRAELERIVGTAAVARMAARFAQPFNEVKLRRTESVAMAATGGGRGQCIAFHLDRSERTMQVPLNEPTDYEGGRLVFALPDGQLVCPPRVAGSATIHTNEVVHGVSELRSGGGARYALFLLRVPPPTM